MDTWMDVLKHVWVLTREEFGQISTAVVLFYILEEMERQSYYTKILNETQQTGMLERRLTHYFIVEESFYGEKLNGFLFQQTQIGHDVVFTCPSRGTQHVIYHRAVTLHFRKDPVHSC